MDLQPFYSHNFVSSVDVNQCERFNVNAHCYADRIQSIRFFHLYISPHFICLNHKSNHKNSILFSRVYLYKNQKKIVANRNTDFLSIETQTLSISLSHGTNEMCIL